MFFIDLEKQNSTVLVEQMRVIDCDQVDKPMRRSGKIVSITKKDWSMIQYQIKREYLLTQLR